MFPGSSPRQLGTFAKVSHVPVANSVKVAMSALSFERGHASLLASQSVRKVAMVVLASHGCSRSRFRTYHAQLLGCPLAKQHLQSRSPPAAFHDMRWSISAWLCGIEYRWRRRRHTFKKASTPRIRFSCALQWTAVEPDPPDGQKRQRPSKVSSALDH